MKLNLARIILFYVVLFVSNFAATALAEDFLDEGKKKYSAKHFKEAGRFFEAEIKINPKNATAHYLLGNVLLELKRLPDAQREYQQSAELDPNGSAGLYSRLALSVLSGKPSFSKTDLQPRQSTYLPMSPENAPANNESATIDSTRTISAEVTRLVQQEQAECDEKVKNILNRANDEVNRLKAEMQQHISDNGAPQYVQTWLPRWGGGYREVATKTYDPEPDNQIIRQDYGSRIDLIGDKARREADALLELYKQKQLALEDSALNAERSYVNNRPTGNIVLSPKGTDIYNRNYQTGDAASGSPVPIMLPPAKLLPGVPANNNKTQ